MPRMCIVLIVIMAGACVRPALAGNRLTAFAGELNSHWQELILYEHKHGHFPVTDASSTWYEKLIAAEPAYAGVLPATPDGSLPLDYYGSPIVYRPPAPGQDPLRLILRATGPNGVDDGGALDDLDAMQQPNAGYWYRSHWPRLHRMMLASAAIAVLSVVGLMWYRRWQADTFALLPLVWAVVTGVAIYGFIGPGSTARQDPPWYRLHEYAHAPLLIGGVLLALWVFPIRLALRSKET